MLLELGAAAIRRANHGAANVATVSVARESDVHRDSTDRFLESMLSARTPKTCPLRPRDDRVCNHVLDIEFIVLRPDDHVSGNGHRHELGR